MGRPINKKFFGNVNPQGVGGSGVATVVVANATSNGPYDAGVTVTFSAPQLPGGKAATGTTTVDPTTFHLTAVNVVSAGSGYTSSPTAALAPQTTGTAATLTVSMAASTQHALAVYAFVQGGNSSVIGDIVKQESSNRYLVKTAQGTSQCKLVAAAPAVGQMNLIATDKNGSTYYVIKLTAHRVILTQNTAGQGGFEFLTNQAAGWSVNAASTGIVSIANV